MKKVLSYLLVLAVLGGVALGFWRSRDIMDYVALRDYQPSAVVEKLADDTTMNDKTRKVFYVNRPQLDDKQSFSTNCPKREETIVLGCYVHNGGIYLLDVTDSRLSGVVQVTAAHELLHAMYERLSKKERADVDTMTADFFATLDNDRIRKNIENYRKNDPSVVPNELHSILATEVRNLSPELENYYKRYFNDRLSIVSYSEKYEKTFNDIEAQVAQISAQLIGIKNELDQIDKQIESLSGQIDVRRSQMDSLLSTGRTEDYNSQVDSFNADVNRYNNLVKQRQTKTNQYNELVEEHNNLATVEANLINSLKTDVKPMQGVR